ncbi:hydrogenase maturation nickel metallochaperone HypA [Corynebacterium uropygiale]|uniref:Hydrogenase maturation factor HypA n=1 Tax=Corynebacterium uropygiale TaxID=1775911 RepID=A0A9X1U0V2_9CORY|nr:hydrogenase maturation nickel metallochaperone HypA [Corynebacterium uropygiale]MCF4007189.1 hydrogenase maturation nickel metallochaperone HypA [Corynebacterium uropygiale]
MHELSLLRGVVDAVEGVAQGRTVLRVGLDVGSRSGVIPEALDGAWPVARQNSVCEGAELQVTEIPAAVWCPSCGCEREIDEFFALTCPVCGTPTADLRHGREFQVTFVDVE